MASPTRAFFAFFALVGPAFTCASYGTEQRRANNETIIIGSAVHRGRSYRLAVFVVVGLRSRSLFGFFGDRSGAHGMIRGSGIRVVGGS